MLDFMDRVVVRGRKLLLCRQHRWINTGVWLHRWINKYAEDQDAFFRDFSAAYLKMIDMGATYA